jgi:itaconate CoA-transferase
MDIKSLYAAKLTTPEKAVAAIPSGSRLSMGMFAAQPPALLKALADRAAAGGVDDLRIYYYETAPIAGQTILRYELNDRIHPYSMFMAAVDRALITRGMQDNGRKVVSYVPNNFHQAPRLLTEEIGIETFLHTVSPMDRHGYFSFGTATTTRQKLPAPPSGSLSRSTRTCRALRATVQSCTYRKWTQLSKTMYRC